MPISIHAPHTGRDRAYKYLCDWVTQFQSTRPIRGATITRATSRLPGVNFNPRAPYGARRAFFCAFFRQNGFQSTRPIRGATFDEGGTADGAGDFNPRAPYGARRRRAPPAPASNQISIHAPHTGRDLTSLKLAETSSGISIHAPHTGRDDHDRL